MLRIRDHLLSLVIVVVLALAVILGWAVEYATWRACFAGSWHDCLRVLG